MGLGELMVLERAIRRNWCANRYVARSGPTTSRRLPCADVRRMRSTSWPCGQNCPAFGCHVAARSQSGCWFRSSSWSRSSEQQFGYSRTGSGSARSASAVCSPRSCGRGCCCSLSSVWRWLW